MTPVVLSARHFDGRSLDAAEVSLELGDATVRFVLRGAPVELPLGELFVSPPIGHAPRFVTLPDGAELLVDDHPALERLPAASPTEGPVAWLERRIGVAVVAVLTMIGGIAAFYFVGLPRLADAAAQRVSPERERALGERSLELINERFMRPTDLDRETMSELSRGFEQLSRQMSPHRSVRLVLGDMGGIANAFALPGSVVVITDKMVTTCTVDESIAVLAHELGHVQHRHALRHLAQELGVTALGAAVTADASSASVSLTTVPLLAARAKYSRDFEEEADAAGFELLRRAGFSPELFATCLERLSKDSDGSDGGYLSTHPANQVRIDRARNAAKGFVPRPKAPKAP
jgi:predicted Zn-dependent protease